MELPINQMRVWVVPHLPLLQTTLQVLVGHQALDIELVAGHKAALLPAADNQDLRTQQSAVIHSQATKNGEVSSNKSDSSQGKGVSTEEKDNAEEGKSGVETSSDKQEASNGEDQQEHLHTQDTLTGVSQLFSEHEDTNSKPDSGEKVQTAW